MCEYAQMKKMGLAFPPHTLLGHSQAASGKENLFALAKLLEGSRHELALVQQVRSSLNRQRWSIPSLESS